MWVIYKRIIISLVTCSLATSLYSQYEGGSGSGSMYTSIMQTSCLSPDYPAIFNGGSDSGSSQAGVTQSKCSPLNMPDIYNGGMENIENCNQLNPGCAPKVDFKGDTTFICAGSIVHFKDLSEGNPISWLWSFPGGTPSGSTNQNPAVKYDIAGSYNVSLTITALTGNNIVTRTNYITVGSLPSVSLSNISPLCENATPHLLTEGYPAGGIYSGWGITSGVFDPAEAGTGNHTFSYKYTDEFGCSDSVDAEIIVNPTFSFTEDHSICKGETYKWQGLNYTSPDTYIVRYTSSKGCDSIYSLNLTVNTVDTSLTVTEHTISANATGASYQWLDCENLYAPVANAVAQSYAATSSGSFAVRVTQSSCTDTSRCVQIHILAIPGIPAEDVSIFPNPVTSDLTIEIKGNREIIDIEIMNSLGQIVFKGNMLERTIVPANRLTPGIYILKLDKGGSSFLQKIIKE